MNNEIKISKAVCNLPENGLQCCPDWQDNGYCYYDCQPLHCKDCEHGKKYKQNTDNKTNIDIYSYNIGVEDGVNIAKNNIRDYIDEIDFTKPMEEIIKDLESVIDGKFYV